MTHAKSKLRTTAKVLLSTTLIILFAYFIFSISIVAYFINYIENPRPVPLNDPELIKYYKIVKKNPGALGFNNYENVTYMSEADNIKLSGWYIPAKDSSSNKCIIFASGWGGNRIMGLKFLNMVKKYELDNEYNMMMFDFRNSGESGKAKMDLGYKISNDFFYTLKYLKKEKGIDDIVICTGSMGSMAALMMLYREDTKNKLDELGIKINKIVLDSPVSNIRENMRHYDLSIRRYPLPGISLITEVFYFVINKKWNGYFDKLRLSVLLNKIDISKVLIIQSLEDNLTRANELISEVKMLNKKPNIRFFPKGSHCGIYDKPENKRSYEKLIVEFIEPGRLDLVNQNKNVLINLKYLI